MRLIEPDEHKEFLATLERIGLARNAIRRIPKATRISVCRAMSPLPDYRRG